MCGGGVGLGVDVGGSCAIVVRYGSASNFALTEPGGGCSGTTNLCFGSNGEPCKICRDDFGLLGMACGGDARYVSGISGICFIGYWNCRCGGLGLMGSCDG